MDTKEFFAKKYEQRIAATIQQKKLESLWRSILQYKPQSTYQEKGLDFSFLGLVYFKRLKDKLNLRDLGVVLKKAKNYFKHDIISAAGELVGDSDPWANSLSADPTAKRPKDKPKAQGKPKRDPNKLWRGLEKDNQDLDLAKASQRSVRDDEDSGEEIQIRKMSNKNYMLEQFLQNLKADKTFSFEPQEKFIQCLLLAFFEASKQNRSLTKYFDAK